MTALPQEFQALIIDETVLKLNISDYSFKKSWQMIVKGKELLLGGPVVKGKGVSWMVESQINNNKTRRSQKLTTRETKSKQKIIRKVPNLS